MQGRPVLKQTSWLGRHHALSRDDLSAYLDGELEPRRVERLERHLQSCAECCRELASLRETQALLRCVPQRPLPCSFVLPASVAVERKRRLLWNTGFAAFRGVSVALGLALILALSGNALLASGRLAAPKAASAVAQEVAAPAAAPVAEAPAEAPEQPEAAPAGQAQAMSATAAQPEAAPRAMAAGQPAAALAAGEAAENAYAGPEAESARKASPADQQGPLAALVAEPRPEAPTMPAPLGDSAVAGVGGGEEPAPVGALALAAEPIVATDGTPSAEPELALAAQAPVQGAPDEASEPLSAVEGGGAVQPEAVDLEALPTRVPTPTPLAPQPVAAAPSPTPEPLVARALPTVQPNEAAAARGEAAGPAAAEAATNSSAESVAANSSERGAESANGSRTAASSDPLAAWQRGLGLAASLLAGALLMSAAGLLWTAHMRRR